MLSGVFNRHYPGINPCRETAWCRNEFLSIRAVIWEKESHGWRDRRKERVDYIVSLAAKRRWKQVRLLQEQLLMAAAEANGQEGLRPTVNRICTAQTRGAAEDDVLKEAFHFLAGR